MLRTGNWVVWGGGGVGGGTASSSFTLILEEKQDSENNNVFGRRTRLIWKDHVGALQTVLILHVWRDDHRREGSPKYAFFPDFQYPHYL